ncbi:unnamed protein product [Caenorhabditis angaria]|uniref:Uncharacterized protein n=1 Tax=Caenorhabditis angaria TaxID=860376 RepID=A0A9P1N1Z7_9PELO|nr:unnamed protein product [Caenorhabditis angaria]
MKPFVGYIEEEKKVEEEAPIKKLPAKILGVIFGKLEYEDAQKLKNSSTSLLNAYKLERRMINGPECDAHVYYKNKELRLEITIIRKIRWTRILPWKRIVKLTKTVPLNQWEYFFKNAKCEKLIVTVDEEIPLEILRKILCCKSIRVFRCFGKSINQMTVDLIAKYQPKSFRFVGNHWISQMMDVPKLSAVMVECFENIDDIFEAMKFTYNLIISLKPEIYEENEHSLIKLKDNEEYKPLYLFKFAKNTDEQQVGSIKKYLENSISNVYGCNLDINVVRDTNDLFILCRSKFVDL